jgi:hypothetical protein
VFAVSDIDDTLARLRKHGAQLVGDVVQYENAYRLCYISGPEGLLIGLAEPLVEIGDGWTAEIVGPITESAAVLSNMRARTS